MAAQHPVTADTEITNVVRRLVEVLRPERIYLFGSRARGEATRDSDYDVMVVVPQSSEPRYRRAQETYRALRGIGVAVDVLVRTRTEFERQAPIAASLPATVLREGRLLYAA